MTEKPPEAIYKNFEIYIDNEGKWFHQGAEIKRISMIRLFSTILYCDKDGQHWLRTPVEYGPIEVADAAFIITSVSILGEGQGTDIIFSDNIDRQFQLGATHPLFFRASNNSSERAKPPYLRLHNGVYARVARTVYYELANHAIANSDADYGQKIGLWGSGQFFALQEDYVR